MTGYVDEAGNTGRRDDSADGLPDFPKGLKGGGALRFILNAVGGAIPVAGGLVSAGAGAWSEREQARVNDFIKHWLDMLAAEMHEKRQTILEIMARIDMKDDKAAERIQSPEYQKLLRKAFRDWAGTESEEKRKLVRNVLTNAAASTFASGAAGSTFASDDVVNLFLDWIKKFSELHFTVIGAIYNAARIARAGVWEKLGRGSVREDSSDADLFKLIFRDLSTGGIVRQHRETDYRGQFLSKPTRRTVPAQRGAARPMKSAFDDDEQYELTALGQQFVHYAMNDVPPKIEFREASGQDDVQAA